MIVVPHLAGGPVSPLSRAAGAVEVPSAPPAISFGVSSLASAVKVNPNKVATVPQPELTSAGDAAGFSTKTGSTLQMYLDLGTLEDELLAHKLSNRVAQLGLPTTIIRRRHLWANSYQVLVGPYNNDEAETRIRSDLLSHGYAPRPFEKGSRPFMFIAPVNLKGARLPAGDITVSWEASYAAKAKVNFLHGRDVIMTEAGKWINRSQKYSRDEYVCLRHGDGSRTLLEIHFSGMNRALVFR